MKTKRVSASENDRLIHVETPLAIVNIYVNLQDAFGHRVERVEVLPNAYSGEPKVTTDGGIRAIRIVEEIPPTMESQDADCSCDAMESGLFDTRED